VLKLAAAGYAAGAGARNLLYDAGVLARRRAPIPVVSVGGLTVGGSGKTPIAADIATRLCLAGARTAIVTHGYGDEMDVHRRLAPDARVYGGRNRIGQAVKAAKEGAEILVLDSGFQHRRLHRDLDVLAIDDIAMRSTPAHLPAGPFREGPASMARADLVVVVRRTAASPVASEEAGMTGRRVEELLRTRTGGALSSVPPVVRARLVPGTLVPVTGAARERSHGRPGVAAAGVMWPDEFFRQVREVVPGLQETVALRDHARVDGRLASRLRDLAGDAGIACTLKDARKLAQALGDSVPIWYLSEEVVWEEPGSMPSVIRAALSLLDGNASSEEDLPT